SQRALQLLRHVDRGRVVEALMCLPADFAKAAGGEIAEIVGERDADAESESGGAGRAGVALGLGEQATRDAVAAKVRVCGEAAEVEVLALPRREHAADEAPVDFRDDNGMVGECGGDGLGGLAERPGLRLEASAVLFEGGSDELGDRSALLAPAEPDADLLGRRAQMPVCSGR